MSLRIEAILAYAGASLWTTPPPSPPPPPPPPPLPQHRDPRFAMYDPSRSYSRFAVDSLPVIAHDGAAEKRQPLHAPSSCARRSRSMSSRLPAILASRALECRPPNRTNQFKTPFPSRVNGSYFTPQDTSSNSFPGQWFRFHTPGDQFSQKTV
jgi:hypothetical protein